jgi:DNA polymerase-3 subunit epsilon
MNERIIVIDFETTGLSANGGDRAIEVGAVALESGQIVDRYQSLINPGFRIDAFIEDYTSISNAMLADAPDSAQVMPQLRDFISDSVLVAHNASFDRGFLEAEYNRLGYQTKHPFICSMRVARRLYPKAPNHRLGTLVAYTRVPECGQFHRALADAEMTGYLWLNMVERLVSKYRIHNAKLALMRKLQSMKISSADSYLRDLAEQATERSQIT